MIYKKHEKRQITNFKGQALFDSDWICLVS